MELEEVTESCHRLRSHRSPSPPSPSRIPRIAWIHNPTIGSIRNPKIGRIHNPTIAWIRNPTLRSSPSSLLWIACTPQCERAHFSQVLREPEKKMIVSMCDLILGSDKPNTNAHKSWECVDVKTYRLVTMVLDILYLRKCRYIAWKLQVLLCKVASQPIQAFVFPLLQDAT